MPFRWDCNVSRSEFQPTEDRDQYSRLTELMFGEAHRLNSIVEQFLSLARPIEIKAEALPVPEILKELAALQESDARESNVQIQVIAAPNLPPLTADPSHLTQVLLNLMLNGIASDARRRNIDTGGENVERQFSHRRDGYRKRDYARIICGEFLSLTSRPRRRAPGWVWRSRAGLSKLTAERLRFLTKRAADVASRFPCRSTVRRCKCPIVFIFW